MKLSTIHEGFWSAAADIGKGVAGMAGRGTGLFIRAAWESLLDELGMGHGHGRSHGHGRGYGRGYSRGAQKYPGRVELGDFLMDAPSEVRSIVSKLHRCVRNQMAGKDMRHTDIGVVQSCAKRLQLVMNKVPTPTQRRIVQMDHTHITTWRPGLAAQLWT